MSKKLTFHLSGPFRVLGPSGENLTPSSAKAQGMLILLLTGVDYARGRAWLQDKLWSDRASAQASGSMRQALTQLRQAFGPYHAALLTNRQRVALDPAWVEVTESPGAEFVEGLDVRDQEFEEWLACERSRRESRPTVEAFRPPSHHSIAIAICDHRSEGIAGWTEKVVADGIARSISELFLGDVVRGTPDLVPRHRWKLSVEASACGARNLAIRIALSQGGTERQIWSGYGIVAMDGVPPVENLEVLKLANEAVEAVGDAILHEQVRIRDDVDPDYLCRRAVRLLFRMRPGDVRAADTLFAQAYEMQPRGLFLAWRAQVKTIQRIERYEADTTALSEAGSEFIARALEAEPNNSMVLAMVANTQLFLFRDPERSIEYAQRSVGINPANPMAWWAMSSARLYVGDAHQSFSDAVRGRNLAMLSPHRFWWDLQHFASSMMLGKIEDSRRILRSIVAQRPEFRPPWRYLIALNATIGEEAAARDASRTLRLMEQDFSVRRLVDDRDYPASLLHKAPQLDLGKVAELGE
jgi:hypothetical protein